VLAQQLIGYRASSAPLTLPRNCPLIKQPTHPQHVVTAGILTTICSGFDRNSAIEKLAVIKIS
jgi:hypothetical protein